MNCTARHGYRQHQILLQRELGQWAAGLDLSLTPLHQRIVHTLDWINMDSLLGYSARTAGAPQRSRVALAQAPRRGLLRRTYHASADLGQRV